jgi:hypothetical protein
MFRRLPGGLVPEPQFAPDLGELGYFLNDQGQIRAIEKPERGFRYAITNNDRYNELQDGAAHHALSQEVSQRLEATGLSKLYLPQLTTQRPETATLPIFMTAQSELRKKKRVIVVINDDDVECGCWSFRAIMSNRGLDIGSAVQFVKDVNLRKDVGLVIANHASLLYSHEYRRAMTLRSWNRRPHPSMQHPAHVIDQELNRIPQNRTPGEHINFIFDKILANPDFVDQDATIDVIGLIDGANEAVEFLNANCGCCL